MPDSDEPFRRPSAGRGRPGWEAFAALGFVLLLLLQVQRDTRASVDSLRDEIGALRAVNYTKVLARARAAPLAFTSL